MPAFRNAALKAAVSPAWPTTLPLNQQEWPVRGFLHSRADRPAPIRCTRTQPATARNHQITATGNPPNRRTAEPPNRRTAEPPNCQSALNSGG
jgi:hypothetical protein